MAQPAQRGGTAGAAGGAAGAAGGTAGTAGGTAGAEGRHSRHRGAAQPAQRGGTAGTEVRHSRRNRGWGARRAQRGGWGARKPQWEFMRMILMMTLKFFFLRGVGCPRNPPWSTEAQTCPGLAVIQDSSSAPLPPLLFNGCEPRKEDQFPEGEGP